MQTYLRIFLMWLPLAVAIVIVCALAYAAVQQNYRQSLNDPQIQIAEDAARILSETGRPTEVVPPGIIDIRDSLAPWIAVYTNDFMPLETNAVLDSKQPAIPAGVFEAARDGAGKDSTPLNENRVTWQSADGTRQALVVIAAKYNDTTYYVVAGRNMREVEIREQRLSITVALALISSLVGSLIAALLGAWISKKYLHA